MVTDFHNFLFEPVLSNAIGVTILEEPSANTEKVVNTSRFCDSKALQSVKLKLRGIEKFVSELSNEAQKELSKARESHSEIEKIYIPSMNFTLLDEYTVSFIDKFFAE